MVTWIENEERPWKAVDPKSTVLLGGKPWVVRSNEKGKKKGTRKVVLSGPGGNFTRTVESKKAVEVKAEPKPFDAKRVFRDLARDMDKREDGGWRVDPKDTVYAKVTAPTKGKPWNGSESKGEKRLQKKLGAVLIGEQVQEGGPYAVPPLDPSTIKSHLWIMHSVEAGSLTFEELVKVHDDEHRRAKAEPFFDLPVPHEHTERRP